MLYSKRATHFRQQLATGSRKLVKLSKQLLNDRKVTGAPCWYHVDFSLLTSVCCVGRSSEALAGELTSRFPGNTPTSGGGGGC